MHPFPPTPDFKDEGGPELQAARIKAATAYDRRKELIETHEQAVKDGVHNPQFTRDEKFPLPPEEPWTKYIEDPSNKIQYFERQKAAAKLGITDARIKQIGTDKDIQKAAEKFIETANSKSSWYAQKPAHKRQTAETPEDNDAHKAIVRSYENLKSKVATALHATELELDPAIVDFTTREVAIKQMGSPHHPLTKFLESDRYVADIMSSRVASAYAQML